MSVIYPKYKLSYQHGVEKIYMQALSLSLSLSLSHSQTLSKIPWWPPGPVQLWIHWSWANLGGPIMMMWSLDLRTGNACMDVLVWIWDIMTHELDKMGTFEKFLGQIVIFNKKFIKFNSLTAGLTSEILYCIPPWLCILTRDVTCTKFWIGNLDA